MLAIRLTRTGKTHDPHYRIVVQEKRSKLNCKVIDLIGHYHPTLSTKLVVIEKEKAEKWLKLGAQPSDTVTNLMVKEGILPAERKIKHFYTAKPKEEVAEKVVKAETPTENTPEVEVTEEEATSEAVAAAEPTTTEEAPEEEAAAEAPAA